MESYTELEVWKLSREMVKDVYLLTKQFPKDELFALTSQTRRSATSIILNIAEGCGRNSENQTLHFLQISRGSLYELETCIMISSDLGFVSNEEAQALCAKCITCKKLLNGFIRYYEKLNKTQ